MKPKTIIIILVLQYFASSILFQMSTPSLSFATYLMPKQYFAICVNSHNCPNSKPSHYYLTPPISAHLLLWFHLKSLHCNGYYGWVNFEQQRLSKLCMECIANITWISHSIILKQKQKKLLIFFYSLIKMKIGFSVVLWRNYIVLQTWCYFKPAQ